MECRNREIGPNPGRNPKKVGAMEAEKLSRFPWCMYPPPVNALRMAKGPEAEALVIPTLGTSFQVERSRIGRLTEVVQSTEVAKPPFRYWVTVIESPSSGVSRSGTRNVVEYRPLELLSTMLTELFQTKEPNRIGGPGWKGESRVLPVIVLESRPPVVPGTSSLGSGVLKLVALVKERFGDQVIQVPRSSSLGVSVSDGSCISPLPSEMFCRRWPPSAKFPQA